ncbi:MFS transporter [Streptococcus suis]|uniref:MFS transporter n=1 Tax=Streptococcus suis TaxID=1307 RepID=UPI000CF59D5D|nr:MFS transporter [Streptococcus suis]HEL1550592.1 MFS transporter [Streptococcus suis]HEL2321716.1 MFS transporter [Streptococcus suis]HEM2762628.1 MFS transporter [Streptococcus suis]
MIAGNVILMLFAFLTVPVLLLVDYEDKQCKPFGLRYWLSLLACIWASLVTLSSYFVVYAAGSIMVFNHFDRFLVGIFLFLVFGASVLTILLARAIKTLIRRTKYYQQMK